MAAGPTFLPFHLLGQRKRPKSARRVTAVRIEMQGAYSIEIHCPSDGETEILKTLTLTIDPKAAVDEKSIVNPERATRVSELAASHDGVGVVGAIVKMDFLILDKAAGPFHSNPLSVVVRTNTVADAGSAASGSGKGDISVSEEIA